MSNQRPRQQQLLRGRPQSESLVQQGFFDENGTVHLRSDASTTPHFDASTVHQDSFRHTPRTAPEDRVVIDLTADDLSRSSSFQNEPGTGLLMQGTMVSPGVEYIGKMAGYEGSDLDGTKNSGTAAHGPKAMIQNSRQGRRLGFTAAASPSFPQFIQPSKVYSGSRYPSTPPLPPEVAIGERQIQVQAQPPKADSVKFNTRRDNRPKPYVLEPPMQAQLLPGGRCSDFFPWKGNHPEDKVTDLQARNGKYDKLFIGKSNNEQASARASLAPIFRNKNGIAILSTLFLTVLNRRQKYGRLTAPSTFKPPPRVTLPDQKREAWLRDLANSSVPLRKLSRTIPHGLKGPSLLDQCAAKNVPSPRAVWFARCVGANELRGLKRKGVGSFALGSEAKWIKEWTSHVIQFLEKTMSGCGNSSGVWKRKMIYAVRLAAHLYSEYLLERTLFLEWYLTFLETTSLDMLPLAYLMLSIYWDELLRTRRLGRRLAEALLGKVEVILAMEGKEIYVPLLRKTSILITDILLSHRESLVIPSSWEQYQKYLIACVDRRSPAVEACLQNITLRNNNLLLSMETKSEEPGISPQKRLISFLDSASMPFDIEEIHQKSSTLVTDPGELVQCLCEWAVTSLRVGLYRTYIVVALLRLLYKNGFGIQDSILNFLNRFAAKVVGNKSDVYLLISELVRSKNFSIAVYMKWLISRGALSHYTSMEKDHPCHVRLLAEVPIHSAPTPIRNLRKVLLSGAGFSIEDEIKSFEVAKGLIASRIAGLFAHSTPADEVIGVFNPAEIEMLRRLSRTVMSELGLWIKDRVRSHVVQGQPVGRDNWRDLSVEVGITAVTTNQFLLLRQVLEEFEDFTVLVDVVKSVSSSDSSETLSSAADTVSYNVEVFSALGAVNCCLQLLFNRYKKLQVRRTLEKFLVVSLVDLASFPGSDEAIRREIESDLANYDSRYPRATVAHSPLSDTMADLFQDGGADSNEEIDRLLARGASIDKDNLSRLFETTVSKMETSFYDTETQGQLFASSSYLMKLRQFDIAAFDELIKGWVMRLLASPSRPVLLQTLSILVANSCLDLGVLVQATLKVIEGKLPIITAGELAVQSLDLLFGDGSFGLNMPRLEWYNLKRKRKIFESNFVPTTVHLIRRSIELCVAANNEALETRVRSLVLSRPALNLIRSVATAQPDLLTSDLVDPLSKGGDASLLRWLRILIDHLLDDDSSDMADVDADVQVSQLLELANDFSIGLCQLKMRIIFDAEKRNPSFVGSRSPIMKSFFRGIASTFKDRGTIWSDLVSVLSKHCACQIRMYAEEIFLHSSTFPRVRLSLDPMEPPLADDQESGESLARALLTAIEATAYSIPSQGVSSMAPILADRVYALIQSISATEDELTRSENGGGPEASWNDSFVELRCWFLLFLRILVLHRGAFSISKSGVTDQGRMVVGLCTLLQHEFIRRDHDLFDFLYDVTSIFIDDLPDDARQQIKRFVKGKTTASSMTYLLGRVETIPGWLKATKGDKLVDYPVKPWEKLAEPTPIIGENDTALSLIFFKTRKARCHHLEIGMGTGE